MTLTSGNKLIVRDTMDEVRERIVEFKRRIYGPDAPKPSARPLSGSERARSAAALTPAAAAPIVS